MNIESLSQTEVSGIVSAVSGAGSEHRAISYLHPDFVIRKGEMHHKRRYDNVIQLSAHFYGDSITETEQETAKNLICANADNYDASVNSISFYRTINELEGIRL